MARKPRLGRGLDSLLGPGALTGSEQQPAPIDAPEGEPATTASGDQLLRLPVELLQRGRYQPRRDMDPQRLEELAASIRAQGVMQPIVVRPLSADRYEIVAGERRWRAAQLAGLERIPAIVRELSDEAAMALALIENIQREELNPVEEAFALQRLVEEFGLTQQAVAETVGRSRAAVANMLRLLRLRGEVRDMLENGDLEMGHARALLSLSDDEQSDTAKIVVGKGMSVRQTEALVRKIQSGVPSKPEPERKDPDIRHLEEDLSQRLGGQVQIRHSARGKGKLTIAYNSLDELDGILGHIK